MEIKKLLIQSMFICLYLIDNVKGFFDKLLSSDKLIFSELKKTIHEQQTTLVKSLEDLKNDVPKYFGN